MMPALAACAPACVSERAPAGGESSGAGETTGTQALSDGEKALEELAEPPALTVSHPQASRKSSSCTSAAAPTGAAPRHTSLPCQRTL